eukprot:jgi/Phyca11/50355/gw1.420.4.1
MEKMLETYRTNITPAQAMKLFTTAKDPKRSWPEHYMYLVAISEACGGGADYLVLNNIVQYASADLRTVLMAKSWEMEAKTKNLGKETVAAVGERRPSCPVLKGEDTADVTLAVNESEVDTEGVWILDSGSNRHLVNDASCLDDVEPYVDSCEQPDGRPLNITKRGTLTLRVQACGKEQTVKLVDVYYAENVVHNLISYGTLDKKGYTLTERCGRRVLAAKNGGRVVDLSGVIMAVLSDEVAAPQDMSSSTQKGTLFEFHTRFGHLNYDSVERLARDPSSGIELTDHRR